MDLRILDVVNLNSHKFECLGNAETANQVFHTDGFIRNCPISSYSIDDDSYINLYGKRFNWLKTLGSPNVLESLFLFTRQAYIQINPMKSKRRESDGNVAAPHCEAAPADNQRMKIIDFLQFINASLKLSINDDIFSNIETELMGLRLFFHKLSFTRLPHSSVNFDFSTSGETNSAFKIIHAQLDVRWMFINIIHSVEERRKLSAVDISSDLARLNFDNEILLLMSELTYLSLICYERSFKKQILQASAFLCVCVKEIWLLLMHSIYCSRSFWVNFIKTLRLVHEVKEPPSDVEYFSAHLTPAEYLHCSNRNEFVIWFLAEICSLQLYTDKGEFSGTSFDGVTHFDILDEIVKSFLSETDVPDESAMQFILPSLQKIHEVWGHAHTGTLTALWEYYNTRLNSTFYLPGSSVSNIVVISKSGQALLEQLRSCLDGPNRKYKHESSFYMWLRLLNNHLRFAQTNGISSTHLSSRIFIKYPTSKKDRLRNLTELGVYHVVSLYLCLGISTCSSSVMNKLVELLAAIPRSNISEAKHDMIWKGYGAALIALESMKGDIAESVQIVLTHADWCIKHTICSPIMHLVDTMNVLFQKVLSDVRGLSLFIGPWIEAFFKVSSELNVTRLLSAFLPLMKCLCEVRNTVSTLSHLQAILTKLEHHILPLTYHMRNSTCAQLAAHFTVISSKYRVELFQTWSDMQDCAVRGSFYITLLELDSDMVHSFFPQAVETAVQTWTQWTCLNGETEEIHHLSRVLSNIPIIKSLGLDWKSEDPLSSFIENLGTEYKYCQTVQDRSIVRKNFLLFFNKFDKWIEEQFKSLTTAPYEVVSRVFRYAGELFIKCPNLIYMKSNPRNLLKSIIDVLILPPEIYKRGYRIPKPIARALTGSLSSLLQGLLSLDSETDVYIGRITRDVIVQYMARLAEIDEEPFVELLRNSTHAVKIAKNLLTIFQVRGAEVPPHAVQVMRVFQQAMNTTGSNMDRFTAERIFETVIETMIEYLISIDDTSPQIINKIYDFITLALTSDRNRQKLTLVLIESCKKNMAFNSEAWFKTAQRMLPLCSYDMKINLIAQVREELELIERRRGVDRDPVLRNRLELLVTGVNKES